MKYIIEQLNSGRDLSTQQAQDIFENIMSGRVPEGEIAQFLIALKNKGESPIEIFAAAQVLRSRIAGHIASHQDINPNTIDVCGTGGDGLNTLNISTAVAFVVAGAGVPVAKHGNKAVSSKSGSSDVMTALGIKLDTDPFKQLEVAKMAYFHAPFYHEAMKAVSHVRAKLAVKTIFNLLGPLLNPAGAKFQLIGVYDPKYLPTFRTALKFMQIEKAWVVHGKDGLDEISINTETDVYELEKNTPDNFTISPEDAGLKTYEKPANIQGGDANYNAAAIVELLKSKKDAYRDIVLLNSSAALLIAGKAADLKEGVKIAAESIDSGKALEVLNKLKAL